MAQRLGAEVHAYIEYNVRIYLSLHKVCRHETYIQGKLVRCCSISENSSHLSRRCRMLPTKPQMIVSVFSSSGDQDSYPCLYLFYEGLRLTPVLARPISILRHAEFTQVSAWAFKRIYVTHINSRNPSYSASHQRGLVTITLYRITLVLS